MYTKRRRYLYKNQFGESTADKIHIHQKYSCLEAFFNFCIWNQNKNIL